MCVCVFLFLICPSTNELYSFSILTSSILTFTLKTEKSQTGRMICFRHVTSHFSPCSPPFGCLACSAARTVFLTSPWSTHNTQTVLPSACVNASVCTSQTQVCTQRNAALPCPHSPLRNEDWHSGVNDALTFFASPPSSLLPSQYTNAAPQPSIWCGNYVHISCQPERFGGPRSCLLHSRGEGLAPMLVKAPLDLRSRNWVWFQLGCR